MKKKLMFGFITLIIGGGALTAYLNAGNEPRPVFQVQVSSYVEGATLSLAKLESGWLRKEHSVDEAKSWREIEPGTQALEEGGHFYRLQLPDGRTKLGLVEVADNSPIVFK